MITLLVLSLLVLVHELGHFLAARLFRVRVEEFGFGIPPKALTLFRRGETEYTLNWLPLGGFVRLYGEQGELSKIEELNPLTRNRAFVHKPAWQRAVILVAGVAMNILVGVTLFAVIYTTMGVPREVGRQVLISQVAPDSPAMLAEMAVGDVVVQVNEEKIETADEFVKVVSENKGKALNLYVKKLEPDGTTSDTSKVITVVPRENPPVGQGALGVAVSDVPILVYEKKPWYAAPFFGIVEGMKESYVWGREIVKGLLSLVINLARGQLPEGLAGPVGVLRVGNEAVESGWMVYLRFVALVSINLGIFNLLPFPALDGGRLLFLLFEKVVGKRRVAKIEGVVHGAGFIFLIGLLILVTWQDLTK